MNHFVDEVDPVDGVIDSIQEQFDVNGTGKCSYTDLIKFMEENNYLNADPESCQKVLQDFKDAQGNVNYIKAMKTLI